MSIFGKTLVSTAVDKRRPHNFNSRHITTADFFQLIPIYHREMVPSSSIKIDVRSFARLKDMPVPTFGEAKMNLRAFFVPMRTIFRGWDDFITDTLHVNSGTQYANHDEFVPFIRNDQFLDLFQKSDVSTSVASTVAFDYAVKIYNSGGTTTTMKYLTFKPLGSQIYKILDSLGYKIAQDSHDQSRFSALPLLSFLRAYLDWYYPSQYYGDTVSALLTSLCLRDSAQDPSFNSDRLLSIFKVVCYTAYGDDYFTSAFDSPNGPTDYANVGASSIEINDINVLNDQQYLGRVVNFTEGDGDYYPNTPVVSQNSNGIGSFSQYVLDSLKSLTDFMKRHQLVGARAFERFAARWNVELPASKLNRSVYLGSHSVDLMVQDVFSTAETSEANLGSYAGKGFMVGQDGSFDFETDEFGYFMICMSITPDIAYCQGIDRKVRHLSKLDFFSPEFDCLGTQAVAAEELFVPQTIDNAGKVSDFAELNQKVFGFMPKYAEYKIPRNQLTGDFKLGTRAVGDTADAWHLFRMFSNTSFLNGSKIVHSRSFVMPQANFDLDDEQAYIRDGDQYDRIFTTENPTEDHFICLFYFKEQHLLPMKPLWDTYEFKDEDEHGSRVVDVNGLKMN